MTTFGAIFDWDGVIVDSAALHLESWEMLARECGKPLPEGHFERGFGMKNEVIIPRQLGWTTDRAEVRRLSLRKEALYRELVHARGIEILPGARALLEGLRAAGIRCVIGSSTQRENITLVLKMAGITPFFQGLVTAEDVHHGKPDPEVFLKAAELIAVPPAWCVVFEDTPMGVEAAKRGGMKALAVTRTHPADRLAAADRVVPDLTHATAANLASLWPTP